MNNKLHVLKIKKNTPTYFGFFR